MDSGCEKKKLGTKQIQPYLYVTTLNYPVLLSDQEKFGADCKTIQFQQFPLPILHTIKRSSLSTYVSDLRHMGKSTVKWLFIGICPLCDMN